MPATPQPRSATTKATSLVKSGPKNLSNPRSTGNAGGTYESRVQAVYLLAHLSGGFTALLPNAVVVGLQFQGRILGYNTDDLVCTLQDRAGLPHKALLQVKQTLKATTSNTAFREAISGAWYDFRNPELFDPRADRIVVVYDGDGDSNVRGASTIAEFARTSATGAVFIQKSTAAVFSSPVNRDALSAISGFVADIVGGPVEPEVLRLFCRCLWFVSHQLTSDTTTEFANIMTRIQGVFGARSPTAPHAVWAELVTTCQRLNPFAATVDFANLDEQVDVLTAQTFARHRNSGAAQLGLREPTAPVPAMLELSESRGAERTALPRASSTRGVGPDVALPTGRPDAANKVISGQLDAINEKLKTQRYEAALEDLASLGKDLAPFDGHQRARWYLQRGVAHWHLSNIDAAAEDFLEAAKLSDDDDKMVSAHVRGLLLKKDIAAALTVGEAARARFPDSENVWVAWANAKLLAGGTIEQADAPFAHREGAGVYQMLAWARKLAGDFPDALALSRKSIDAADANFFTRNDALAIAVEAATTNGVNSTYRLVTPQVREALEVTTAAFEPRAERLWPVQASQTVEAVATHLGYAFLLLGQPERALALAQEARARGVTSAALNRVELDSLNEAKQIDQFKLRGRALVNELEEAGLVSLAQAAAHAEDIALVDLAIEAMAKLTPSRPDTMATLQSIRWMGMYFSPMRVQAVREVRALVMDDSTPFTTLLSSARMLFAEKDVEAVEPILELARKGAAREGVPEATLLLAELLHQTKHFAEAAKTYASVLPAGQHSELHTRWLHSLIRASDRRGAKRLLETFPVGWADDDDARGLATELAQSAGDWDLMRTLSQAQMRVAPTHASSVLLAFMVAEHSEPLAALVEMLDGLPADLEGTVQQVSQVAVLEMKFGHAVSGMNRIYKLRRMNSENIEAASAFMLAYCVVPDNLPDMEETLPEIAAGTSCLLRQTDGQEMWLSLDPAAVGELPETTEFKNARSTYVAPFLGKKVGDTVQLPKTFGFVRDLSVVQISSVHRRMIALAQQAINVSLVPVPNATSISIPSNESGTDFSEMVAQLRRNGDHARRAFELYASSPLTLGALGRLLHRSPVVLGAGWPSEGTPLITCQGVAPEIESGMALLRDERSVFIVDAVTLSELSMLGRLDVLKALPKVLVCVRTRDEITAQFEEARETRSTLTAFESEGKLGVVEVTPQDRTRQIAFLQAILDAIDGLTELVPAYGPEVVPPLLLAMKGTVSDEEYSMLLVASDRGAHLLTTDGRLRDWAAQLEIKGAWTQLALMRAVETGVVIQDDYSRAVAKLFVLNRSFVMLTGHDLVVMCHQSTAWLRAGIVRFKTYLASDGIDFNSAANATVEFLRAIVQCSTSNGAFGELLKHVAEGLARNKIAPANLASQLARVLGEMLIPRDGVYVYQLADVGRQVEARRAATYLATPIATGLARARFPVQPYRVQIEVLVVGRTPWLQKCDGPELDEPADNKLLGPDGGGSGPARRKNKANKKRKGAPNPAAQGQTIVHQVWVTTPLAAYELGLDAKPETPIRVTLENFTAPPLAPG